MSRNYACNLCEKSCYLKSPLCGQIYGRTYIIKKKSKNDFYATNCELYKIVHSDQPKAADREIFYKDVGKNDD